MVDASDPDWDHALATMAVPAYRDLSGDDSDQVLRSFAVMRDSGPLIRLAGMRSGQAVGFVAAVPEPVAVDPQMPSWQVWWLAVSQTERRQGAASRMFAELETRARAQGVGRLWLWSWATATGAPAFYATAGWDPIRRVIIELHGDARGPLESRWIYVKQLRATASADGAADES